MSRTKLLLEVVQDIQALSNSLQNLAEALMAGEPQFPTKEEEMPFDTANMTPTKPIITLDEVKAVMVKQSQAGLTKQVQSIIHQFDAKKLSDVDPKYYEEMLLLAEELSHD